ncbi:unnamed protein product [Didymodactylos carnosus]|uniref:Uncharacterized protein n=2 Tax=Didymodactylos carnosus TaxID=1234261 RepID=A0A8S2IHH9_9BILA|nr:unnamed protein product [Didymodactylos carnosus]CAF3751968.1 unnamed protein product [Didymodactylos carnosus]
MGAVTVQPGEIEDSLIVTFQKKADADTALQFGMTFKERRLHIACYMGPSAQLFEENKPKHQPPQRILSETSEDELLGAHASKTPTTPSTTSTEKSAGNASAQTSSNVGDSQNNKSIENEEQLIGYGVDEDIDDEDILLGSIDREDATLPSPPSSQSTNKRSTIITPAAAMVEISDDDDELENSSQFKPSLNLDDDEDEEQLLRNLLINGHELESNLVKKLPNLKAFQFSIRCHYYESTENDIDMIIRTYQSDYWIQIYPKDIGFYYVLNRYFATFSVPYAFEHISGVSNNIVNYRSNRTLKTNINNNTVLMEKLRKIVLCDPQSSYTLKLFLFLQSNCPRLRELWFFGFTHLNDDVLPTNIQLSKIKMLLIAYDEMCQYKSVRCSLLLLPNLKVLAITHQLLLTIFNDICQDHQKRDTRCKQVDELILDYYDYQNQMKNEEDEIRRIFPNLKVYDCCLE